VTDTPCDSSLPARYTNGRFGPGNPGRRPGSRNQASRRVVMAILEHFERNREGILDRLGNGYTPAYAGLLGRLLPRQVELAPSFVDDVSDGEIDRMLSGVRATVGGHCGDPRGALIEVEAILVGEKAS
jgi:hypothetical protein